MIGDVRLGMGRSNNLSLSSEGWIASTVFEMATLSIRRFFILPFPD